jgi:hypothetical protein
LTHAVASADVVIATLQVLPAVLSAGLPAIPATAAHVAFESGAKQLTVAVFKVTGTSRQSAEMNVAASPVVEF